MQGFRARAIHTQRTHAGRDPKTNCTDLDHVPRSTNQHGKHDGDRVGGYPTPSAVALQLAPARRPRPPSVFASFLLKCDPAASFDSADADGDDDSRRRCSQSPTSSRTFALSAALTPPTFSSASTSAAASPPPSSSRSSAVSKPSSARTSTALRAGAAGIFTARSACCTGRVPLTSVTVRATSAARRLPEVLPAGGLAALPANGCCSIALAPPMTLARSITIGTIARGRSGPSRSRAQAHWHGSAIRMHARARYDTVRVGWQAGSAVRRSWPRARCIGGIRQY
eukprot:SAG31_NODE_11083_length_1068_cov_1.138287_1_plen_283_part_00